MLCERGTTFGYEDLVVDPRSLIRMRTSGLPVVMDVTHCLQRPSSRSSGANGEVVSDGDVSIARISRIL
jgi:2-dehydro-3-deoxyphosphooctonate aldolase (KDO 8-P synthase)